MTPRAVVPPDPLLVRVYRWLIAAYPPAFVATFGDSMAADFNDALRDARRTGRAGDVAILLTQVGRDLLWSITVQWARTSVPWLTMAHAIALLCFCEGLASALRGSPFRWPLVMMMLPLVSTITFTFWFLLPHVRRRRAGLG